MHPDWLSNAYLIADEPGGTAVFVDSGAPLEPLFEAVEREGLTVTHLLTTHADHDHIAGDAEIQARYGCPIVKGPLETGGLSIEALPTPGHKDDHLAFVINGETCCTGDVLFKDAVGGGDPVDDLVLARVRAPAQVQHIERRGRRRVPGNLRRTDVQLLRIRAGGDVSAARRTADRDALGSVSGSADQGFAVGHRAVR